MELMIKAMIEIIEATYEKGVLKPAKKLNLAEGEKVIIKVQSRKVITKDFIKKLDALSREKIEGVAKVLEEIRDD